MKLVTLKDYFNSVGYKITSGSEYLWGCYGKDAFALDADKKSRGKYTFSTGIIFDTKKSKVYQMNSWDYKKKIIYRWVHPRYYKKYLKENKERGINPFKDEEGYQILEVSANKILLETKNVMNK
jgi:hypothetical protein